MKSFLEYISEEREVSFDHSTEPRSTIGATDAEKQVKICTILMDGPALERKFRLAVIYVNPRRDDGRTMDVFPAYGQPACSTVEELRAVKPEDAHGVVETAIKEFENSPTYVNLEKLKEQ